MTRWIGLSLLAAALPAAASGLDRELYARLLQDYTREVEDLAQVRVDYRGLREEPRWRRLVASLEATDPGALASEAERMAFWIDAYNILAIEWVVREDPEESIRDIGNFLFPVWKRTVARIDGREVSLDEIEHDILRPMGDPRIHGAVVCASLSCPPLRREPYRPATLDAQLDDNVRTWLADPRKGLRIDRDENVVWLSSIFKWFREDFEAVGGPLAFARRHAPEAQARWLADHADRARVRHLDYDWSLNALEDAPGR